MRLTFLGTGPAVAIPRDGHDDPQCRDARRGGKSRRGRSAAIVRQAKTSLLFDAGPDVAEQLARERVNHLDAVFLTHGHADATDGIRLLDQWWNRTRHAQKLPIITDAKTAHRLRQRFGALPCLQWVAAKPFDEIGVGRMRIILLPVAHAMTKGFPTVGFLVNDRLAYASDVADLPEKTAKRLKGVATLVLDGAFYFGKKILPSHLTTDEAIAWGKKLGVGRLILTQIGHTYPPHDIAAKEIKKFSRVTLAYDGYAITVP